MRFTFLLPAFLLLAVSGYSQQVSRCATHDVYLQNIQKYPGYHQAVEQAFQYAKAQRNYTAKQGSSFDTVYRIPVVVHVVYKTAQQNVSDSLIRSQIAVLNQDYRRQNADTSEGVILKHF